MTRLEVLVPALLSTILNTTTSATKYYLLNTISAVTSKNKYKAANMSLPTK